MVGEVAAQIHVRVQALSGLELPNGGLVIPIRRGAVLDETGADVIDPLRGVHGIDEAERGEVGRIAAAVEGAGGFEREALGGADVVVRVAVADDDARVLKGFPLEHRRDGNAIEAALALAFIDGVVSGTEAIVEGLRGVERAGVVELATE